MALIEMVGIFDDALSFSRSAKLFVNNLNRGLSGASGDMMGLDKDAYLKSIAPK